MRLPDGEMGLLENVARSMHTEGLINDETLATLLEFARHDWAVRVLDAWADAELDRSVDLSCGWQVAFKDKPHLQLPGQARVRLLVSGNPLRLEYGDIPPAARLAAAEAVWSELPESVRAELGERP